MTQVEEMFFSKEQVLKEKAEEKDKWVSPTLVKEKLGGKVEVTIIHHKNIKGGIRLILQTGKSSGEKLTSAHHQGTFGGRHYEHFQSEGLQRTSR